MNFWERTWEERGDALKHCTTLMGLLMPAMPLVWLDHGANEDWGLLCYPPLNR